jgi:hypothetical protein
MSGRIYRTRTDSVAKQVSLSFTSKFSRCRTPVMADDDSDSEAVVPMLEDPRKPRIRGGHEQWTNPDIVKFLQTKAC